MAAETDTASFTILIEGIQADIRELRKDVHRDMHGLRDEINTLTEAVRTLAGSVVTRDYCSNTCQPQWVPKGWGRPVIAACGFAILLAGIAGDWVDALAKMGWRP